MTQPACNKTNRYLFVLSLCRVEILIVTIHPVTSLPESGTPDTNLSTFEFIIHFQTGVTNSEEQKTILMAWHCLW